MAKNRKKNSIFIRNFIFGIEDSLVSTVGLLSGVASAGVPNRTVFLSGAVLIFVEAFSMATGSFMSEESGEEYESQKEARDNKPLIASIIMFFSYFLSGFIPLTPYILLDHNQAFFVSIGASLSVLFLLGFLTARIFHVSMIKKGTQMVVLGGLAIVAGIVVGKLLDTYLI